MPGFWKCAEADPTYLAVVDPDGTEHIAGDILGRCNQLLHALRALGMQKGDTVAAVLPNGNLPLTALLAAQQGGFYYVPINYRLAPPEIAYILKDSEAKVLLSHERFAGTIVPAADEAEIPNTKRLAVGTIPGFGSFEAALAAQPTTRPDDLSAGQAMHYTSGTTGFPKGVKRPLPPIDPDMMAELMTGFFGLFGIPQADDNVHL